jgi:hypothetical protein
LAKKQCAQARSIRIHFWRIPLRILPEIQAKHSGRAFGTPTHWLVQSLLVLFWCLYCTKLEPIFKINKADEFLRNSFLGKRIRKNSTTDFLKFSLARAEEGSGEESARASAFSFFGRAG